MTNGVTIVKSPLVLSETAAAGSSGTGCSVIPLGSFQTNWQNKCSFLQTTDMLRVLYVAM